MIKSFFKIHILLLFLFHGLIVMSQENTPTPSKNIINKIKETYSKFKNKVNEVRSTRVYKASTVAPELQKAPTQEIEKMISEAKNNPEKRNNLQKNLEKKVESLQNKMINELNKSLKVTEKNQTRKGMHLYNPNNLGKYHSDAYKRVINKYEASLKNLNELKVSIEKQVAKNPDLFPKGKPIKKTFDHRLKGIHQELFHLKFSKFALEYKQSNPKASPKHFEVFAKSFLRKNSGQKYTVLNHRVYMNILNEYKLKNLSGDMERQYNKNKFYAEGFLKEKIDAFKKNEKFSSKFDKVIEKNYVQSKNFVATREQLMELLRLKVETRRSNEKLKPGERPKEFPKMFDTILEHGSRNLYAEPKSLPSLSTEILNAKNTQNFEKILKTLEARGISEALRNELVEIRKDSYKKGNELHKQMENVTKDIKGLKAETHKILNRTKNYTTKDVKVLDVKRDVEFRKKDSLPSQERSRRPRPKPVVRPVVGR